jgi:hypothetical protein
MFPFAITCGMTGSMVGIVLPAAWGCWILHDLAVQSAALPPGTGQCGMPGVFAWFLILFGWPFGAFIGGLLGFVAGGMYRYVADTPPFGIPCGDPD